MVFYCCVKNCKNHWIPNSHLTFHRFPWSNPSLLNSWLNVVPCRNHKVSQSSRICSDHFTKDDYENNMGITRRLKKNAIPQNFPSYELSKVLSDCSQDNTSNDVTQSIITALPQCSEDSQHSSTPTTNKIFDVTQSVITTLPQCSEDLQHSSTLSSNNIFHEHNYDLLSATDIHALNTDQKITDSTNNKIPENKETFYRTKIKTLQKRLQRSNKKIEELSNVITLLKSESNCTQKLEKDLKESFSNDILELFFNLKNNQNKQKKGHRYTEKMKEFANTIYSYSPEAYKSLQKKLCLPDKTTLRKSINGTSNKVGSVNGLESIEGLPTNL